MPATKQTVLVGVSNPIGLNNQHKNPLTRTVVLCMDPETEGYTASLPDGFTQIGTIELTDGKTPVGLTPYTLVFRLLDTASREDPELHAIFPNNLFDTYTFVIQKDNAVLTPVDPGEGGGGDG